ncbi:MAG: glycosyltransferase [Gammaproteobacteria bacterium]|nr:MAG: glycosyltransferase [Gammaproteobacteria bacterium]
MADQAPAVTAILLSCNCAGVIRAALQSVLGQQGPPLEVLVSDDASTDDTFAVLERELAGYSGPHHVLLRRRAQNSGSKSAHLNEVFPLTRGRYLVSFDGDDVSEPQRVQRLLAAFAADPRARAVYSDYSIMDPAGRAGARRRVRHPPAGTDPRPWFARIDAFASGTTLAVRREVVEVFGPLDPQVHEDVALPFRAALLGTVHHVDEPLVRVRRRGDSLTAAYGRFASIEDYRDWWRRGIEGAGRHLASRLADLATAEGLSLVPPAELGRLAEIARESLAEAEASAGLVSPSPLRRLRTYAWLARNGMPRDELLLNAALVLAPRLYLRYKRRRP